jgi:hypothetical protein
MMQTDEEYLKLILRVRRTKVKISETGNALMKQLRESSQGRRGRGWNL